MVVVTAASDHVALRAPFHPSLPYRCRALGGRWRGAAIGWVFDPGHEDALRAVCLDLFGLDGREEALQDLVEIEAIVGERSVIRSVFESYNGSILLLGREIVVALPNRNVARPGRGIRFLKGRPLCRRRSESCWISVPNGSVFVMRAVPRVTLARLTTAIGDAGSVRVV